MKRAIVLLALVACHKKADAPKLFLDGGKVVVQADAPPPPDAPPPVVEKPTPAQLAVGDTIACVRMSNETVRCWHAVGGPEDMQLRGVKDLVASAGFACAFLDDKSVACWGDIGFGATRATAKPTGVPGVTKATRIFAVGGAGCASIEGGALACWGDIDEKGRITKAGAHRPPTAVAGVDHVVALAAGMAVREGGAVFSGRQQLPLTDAVEVATLGDTSCVRHAGGTVSCTPPDPPCTPPAPPPPPPKKGKKPAPKAPPKPPEPKPALPDVAFGKTKQLAFELGELCALDAAGQVACVDPAKRCPAVIEHRASPPLDEIDGTCGVTRKRGVVCFPKAGGKAAAIAAVDHVVALAGTAVQACALDHDHRVSCWKDAGPATVIPLD